MKISNVTEMRALDRTAIETYGIKEELLMENAGDAVYFIILTKFGIKKKRFVVFCGMGNNGGDGFVENTDYIGLVAAVADDGTG